MNIENLVAALGACTNPNPEVRKAAEDALNQVCPGAKGPTMACCRRRCCCRCRSPHSCPSALPLPCQAKHARGQVVNLLRVALEDSVDPSVRQVAAISFKNLVRRDWAPNEGALAPLLAPLCTAPRLWATTLLPLAACRSTLVLSRLAHKCGAVAHRGRQLLSAGLGLPLAVGWPSSWLADKAARLVGRVPTRSGSPQPA